MLCNSCGDVLTVNGATGDVVSVQVGDTGRAEFRCISEKVNVCDVIGRSLSIDNTTNG